LARHASDRQSIFVIGRTGQQHGFGRTSAQTKDGRLVARYGLVVRGAGHSFEAAFAIIAKESELTAAAAPDDQIIPTIVIVIEPRNTWSQLGKSFWKQRLRSKIIKEFIRMGVFDFLAYIAKEGRWDPHYRFGRIGCGLFIHFIDAIGFCSGNDRALAGAP